MEDRISGAIDSHTLRFSGRGAEYFPIWLVNVVCTVLTCGLFYPWAVVRTRQYFYRHSALAGYRFDYHASGSMLFPGWLMLMGFAVLLWVASMAGWLVVLPVALAVIAGPLLLIRGYRFQLQMTSLNGTRFNHYAPDALAWRMLAGIPLLCAVIIALFIGLAAAKYMQVYTSSALIYGLLFWPILLVPLVLTAVYGIYRVQRLLLLFSQLRYGEMAFSCSLSRVKLGGIFIVAVLAAGVLYIMPELALAEFMYNRDNVGEEEKVALMIVTGPLALYLALSVGYGWLWAMTRRHVYHSLSLQGAMHFASHARAGRLIWIIFSNMLLCGLTSGLFWPWAKVRLARYLQANTVVNGELSGLMALQNHGEQPDCALASRLSRGLSLLSFSL
ncbi:MULTISPECIES: YjgN family protein [Tenebrionibacter/Tenebrionicola group]|jgi:uncharacterized membrane protein YjgN (DUF898 family)|uniref:DUF898 family protein n=2 Tax=Tenebrionibacter/Tenebrionicola group TaxID=2969848 RepID=A0A8K0V577_9ENTR|nr:MULTISPECIES: DUF898 domain-containing protein [Tenebrionibacter/Tenebrionicola group]MBK4715633.1 DUF898 family protein [Tenebrionibacter intestinalis]MBV5094583.1 DUF898 family protein [Tenebrionicola larvae]